MIDEVDFYLEDLVSKFKKIDPNKYFLSYSGGKDSHLIYWFMKEWVKERYPALYVELQKIPIVSINTYMEHPEILERMRKNSDVILKPLLKPFEIKEKYGIPCFSKFQDEIISRYQRGSRAMSTMMVINGGKMVDGNDASKQWTRFKLNNTAKELLLSGKLHKVSPYCCKYMKKEPIKQYEKKVNKKQMLGVRGGEGYLREAKYRSCFTKDGKFTPLWDLTNELENKIYEKYNIEIPEVYNYVPRTGCMGCPYGSKFGNIKAELSLVSPNQYNFIVKYFKESYEVLGIIKKEE